jgi:6-phosphogluconolactonase
MNYTHLSTEHSDAFIAQAVLILVEKITAALAERQECFIGLSGGFTPLPIYEALLATDSIDWSKVYFFMVDERYISIDEPQSNQYRIRQILRKHPVILEEHCVFPDTTLPIPACIALYTKQLTALFAHHGPDIIVLGMGNDGHIASLFPPVPEAAFGEVLVLHTETDSFPVHDRITVSPLVLLAATTPILCIQGHEKLQTFNETIAAELNPVRYPLHVLLAHGRLIVVSQG